EGILEGAAVLSGDKNSLKSDELDGEKDPIYDEAVHFVVSQKKYSISAVQRQFRVGYNRAARLIEDMEKAGLLSPMQSNGSRSILRTGEE
ncbi:MAG: DNA translocase FtsK, partial [Ferrovum sp.]|nr:DNA translocase FtsK [Ferrovum sp.]